MERALADGESVSFVERANEDQGLPRSSLAVPLKSRGGLTIGVVDLTREGSAQEWTDEERELIEALVAQTAESIVAEQLFEQTQLALAEARRLYEAGRRISAASDRDSIFEVVLDIVATTTADRAAIFVFDPPPSDGGPQTQELVSYWDLDRAGAPVPLGTGFSGRDYPLAQALTSQEPVVVADARSCERTAGAVQEILGVMEAHSAAFVPLSVGSDWLGFVAVMTRRPHTFTTDELRVYQAVSNQAALALQSLRLLRDAESRVRRERVIREISTKISDTVDLDSILNTTVQELGRALGVSRAFVKLTTGSETTALEDGVAAGEVPPERITVLQDRPNPELR
jgi:GAF domain-containing protein